MVLFLNTARSVMADNILLCVINPFWIMCPTNIICYYERHLLIILWTKNNNNQTVSPSGCGCCCCAVPFQSTLPYWELLINTYKESMLIILFCHRNVVVHQFDLFFRKRMQKNICTSLARQMTSQINFRLQSQDNDALRSFLSF